MVSAGARSAKEDNTRATVKVDQKPRLRLGGAFFLPL